MSGQFLMSESLGDPLGEFATLDSMVRRMIFFFGGGFFLWPFSLFFLGLGYTLGCRGLVQGPLGDKPAEEAGCRGEMQIKKRNMVTAQDLAVWPKGP